MKENTLLFSIAYNPKKDKFILATYYPEGDSISYGQVAEGNYEGILELMKKMGEVELPNIMNALSK